MRQRRVCDDCEDNFRRQGVECDPRYEFSRHCRADLHIVCKQLLYVYTESESGMMNCIVKYCAEHKEQVILMTADKTMALKARMYGVKTKYLKQIDNVCTLFVAKRIKNQLCISDFNTEFRWLFN